MIEEKAARIEAKGKEAKVRTNDFAKEVTKVRRQTAQRQQSGRKR